MFEFLQACKDVIDYMWEDEATDWEECGKPDNHIFKKLEIISEFLEAICQWSNGLDENY